MQAQPVQSYGTPVVVVQPSATANPTGAYQTNRSTLPTFEHVIVGGWKDDLCNCCSQIIPSCMMAFCCSCILAGQLAERIGMTNCFNIACGYTTIVVILVICVLAGVDGRLLLLIWPFATFMVYSLRKKVREMFTIPGDDCSDCMLGCCCAPCALAQMSRHVYMYRSECGDCVCTSNGVSPYEQAQRTHAEQHQQNNQNRSQYPQPTASQHYVPTQYAYSQPQYPYAQSQVGVAAPVSSQQAPPSYATATYSAAPTTGAVAVPYTQGYEAHDKI